MSAGTLTTEVLVVFYETNDEIIGRLDPDRFLSNPLQFIFVIRPQQSGILTDLLNKTTEIKVLH